MNVHLPTTLAQLWPLLDRPHVAIMAGGTDLLVRQRQTASPITDLCCLERIRELADVYQDSDGLRIGALTTLTELLESQTVTTALPLLHAALRQLGSPLIRNQATLGGNICTASPAGDTLPPLYALDARLEIVARDSRRMVAIDDFITGPGRTTLRPGEILAAVHIPRPAPGAVQHFEKVGRRRALAISVASLAAVIPLDRGLIHGARLALGSVGPRVLRCREAESCLQGRPLTREPLTQAATLIRQTVQPISDVRATAEYRRQVAGNLMLRLGNISEQGW